MGSWHPQIWDKLGALSPLITCLYLPTCHASVQKQTPHREPATTGFDGALRICLALELLPRPAEPKTSVWYGLVGTAAGPLPSSQMASHLQLSSLPSRFSLHTLLLPSAAPLPPPLLISTLQAHRAGLLQRTCWDQVLQGRQTRPGRRGLLPRERERAMACQTESRQAHLSPTL